MAVQGALGTAFLPLADEEDEDELVDAVEFAAWPAVLAW
jgi:hypothetical protein